LVRGLFPIVTEVVVILYFLWGQIKMQTFLSESPDNE